MEDKSVRSRRSYRSDIAQKLQSEEKQKLNRNNDKSPDSGRRSRPTSLTRSECNSDNEHISDEDINAYLECSEGSSNSKSKITETSCAQFSPRIKCLSLVALLFILFIALAAGMYFPSKTSIKEKTRYKNCAFDKLKKKYSFKDDSFFYILQSGVEGVLNSKKSSAAIYLFLIDNKSQSNLVKNFAARASECFDPKSKLIELNKTDFTNNDAVKDYGVIVHLYKEKLKDGGVSILANLNEIPSSSAKALHSICDTYSPIVDKSIVFLTLIPNTSKGNPTLIAENTLTNLWQEELEDNELGALIARVTDQVIQLNTSSIQK